MRYVTAIALFALAFAASGCRASASASLNTGAKAQPEEPVEPASEPRSGLATAEVALFGARHDLQLSPDRKNPTCNCVAIALGKPNDPGMKWDGPAPNIDPANQLVIALSSEGVTCAEPPKEGIGASYWGYKEAGDDVIVVLEVARLGRPVTTGAIIPKPVGNGQVHVQPANKTVPYGRALNASDPACRLGNPGGPRAAARIIQEEDEAVTDQVLDGQ